MDRRAGLACLLAVTVLSAGYGSAARPAGAPASPAPPLSLTTSMDAATGTWAIAVMGGSAASHNNFWQLFVPPAGTSKWRLVTPPGRQQRRPRRRQPRRGAGGGRVPAQPARLSYSRWPPPTTTAPPGRPASWPPGWPDVPDALAVAPANGRLLALLTNGKAAISGPHGTGWTTLASQHSLAGTAAATRCRPGSLTAAASSPSGVPLLTASCVRPGTAGIFAYVGGSWHPAGPTLPGTWLTRPFRAPPYHHRQRRHGPARGRQRPSGPPADSHLRRQQRPLDPVASAAAGPRAHLGVI